MHKLIQATAKKQRERERLQIRLGHKQQQYYESTEGKFNNFPNNASYLHCAAAIFSRSFMWLRIFLLYCMHSNWVFRKKTVPLYCSKEDEKTVNENCILFCLWLFSFAWRWRKQRQCRLFSSFVKMWRDSMQIFSKRITDWKININSMESNVLASR